MTTPVSTPNSSYYDPNAQFTPADGSQSVAESSEPITPRVVNLPPVMIVGDAGAQQLVQRYDTARKPPDCSLEGAEAALACGKAGLVAAGGIVLGPLAVGGLPLAVATTFAEGVSCGKELRAYYNCKTQ